MNFILFLVSLLFDPEQREAYNYEIGCGEITRPNNERKHHEP